MDKQERKIVLHELKLNEQEKLISMLPMRQELLKVFFDYLDTELTNGDNGSSLKLTKGFCSINNLDFEKVKEWAAELGGYDDAEILWNVEDKYEFLIAE